MLRFMLVRGSNRPADASSADDKGASSLPSAVWRMRAVRAAATISRGGGVRLVGTPPVGTGAVGERGCSSRSSVGSPSPLRPPLSKNRGARRRLRLCAGWEIRRLAPDRVGLPLPHLVWMKPRSSRLSPLNTLSSASLCSSEHTARSPRSSISSSSR